jgi:hypothetical protein
MIRCCVVSRSGPSSYTAHVGDGMIIRDVVEWNGRFRERRMQMELCFGTQTGI